MEACTHRHGDFDKVHWFETDLASGGRAGYTLGKDVWLDHDWKNERLAVAHESFHVLGGSGDHHEPEWKLCNLL